MEEKKSKVGLAVGITIAICLVVMIGVGYGCYVLGSSHGLFGSMGNTANKVINSASNMIDKTIEEQNKMMEEYNNTVKEVTKNDKGEFVTLDIKVEKAYILESGNEVHKLYLLDNGTYTDLYISDINGSTYGTYYLDGDILYLNDLLYGGNGSTLVFKDVQTSKYKVKSDGLYNVTTDKLVYKVSNEKTVSYNLYQEIYNFIYYFDVNPYYSASGRSLAIG